MRYWLFLDLSVQSKLLILYGIITLGSTTFLIYNFQGNHTGSNLLYIVNLVRLPLSIYVVYSLRYFFIGTFKKLWRFWILYFLTILLVAVISADLTILTYSVWYSCSFMAIFMTTYNELVVRKIKGSRYLASILFWSSIVVFPMILLGLPDLIKGNPEGVKFTSKTTYVYPVYFLIIALILKFKNTKKSSLIEIIAMMVLTLVLFLSGKRLITLGAVSFSLIYFLFLAHRSWIKDLVSLILTIIVGFTFIDSILESRTAERIANFNERTGSRGSTDVEDRVDIWNYYLERSADNYYIGLGIGAGVHDENKIQGDLYLSGFSYHNSFIGLIYEGGIVAFLVYFIILVQSILVSFRRSNIMLTVLLLTLVALWSSETHFLPGEPMYVYGHLILAVALVKRRS